MISGSRLIISGKLPVIVENLDLVTNYAPVRRRNVYQLQCAEQIGRQIARRKESSDGRLAYSEWQEINSFSLSLPPGYQVKSQPRSIALTTNRKV